MSFDKTRLLKHLDLCGRQIAYLDSKLRMCCSCLDKVDPCRAPLMYERLVVQYNDLLEEQETMHRRLKLSEALLRDRPGAHALERVLGRAAPQIDAERVKRIHKKLPGKQNVRR